MAEIFKVSTSGYYLWVKRPKSNRDVENDKLTSEIIKIHTKEHKIPGSIKITKKLSTLAKPINHKRVARLMKKSNIKSKVVKKYKATTNSKHSLPVAENILNRNFEASKKNEKWVTDITYVWTDEGWLYLAGVLDLYGRIIVGWAMGSRMTKELVISAIKQAIGRTGRPKGVLAHSDRGSQYASLDYQKVLKENDFTCSMSRKGNCWDNAPMESFWGKLKMEWLNDKKFKTRDEARREIFYYIEIYYNRERQHSSNNYQIPATYKLTG